MELEEPGVERFLSWRTLELGLELQDPGIGEVRNWRSLELNEPGIGGAWS